MGFGDFFLNLDFTIANHSNALSYMFEVIPDENYDPATHSWNWPEGGSKVWRGQLGDETTQK